MVQYIKTAQMACLEKANEGILSFLPDIILKISTLIPLIFLWRAVMSSGVDVGISMNQMLSYAYVSALLSDMMVVKTAATGWLSEGVFMRLLSAHGADIPTDRREPEAGFCMVFCQSDSLHIPRIFH